MTEFTYVSPKAGKTRVIDLNVQACLQARIVEEMNWNAIGTTGAHQDKQERTVRFGAQCNVANLMDVRTTSEWETEVRKFATDEGHAVDMCLAKAMSTPRGSNGTAVSAPAPAPTATLPEVSASEIASVLRKLEARQKETALLQRIVSEDLALKTRHYGEESEMLTEHVAAVKTLQAELQAEEAAAATATESVTETEEDLTEVCKAIAATKPEEATESPEEEVTETETEDDLSTARSDAPVGDSDDSDSDDSDSDDDDEGPDGPSENDSDDSDVETESEEDTESALLTETSEEDVPADPNARRIAVLQERIETVDNPHTRAALQSEIDGLM